MEKKNLKKKNGVALKKPNQRKSHVRRCLWQALKERYRKLCADIKIIKKAIVQPQEELNKYGEFLK